MYPSISLPALLAQGVIIFVLVVVIRAVHIRQVLSGLVAKSVGALLIFIATGLFWLDTGGDLKEHLYKVILCPFAKTSPGCAANKTAASNPALQHRERAQAPEKSAADDMRPQQSTSTQINAIIRGQ